MNTTTVALLLRIIAASAMVSLSTLSLVKSETWVWWGWYTGHYAPGWTGLSELQPISVLAGGLVVVASLGMGLQVSLLLGFLSLLAQLPGIISHTQLPWLGLFGDLSFQGTPHVAIIAFALLVTPISTYVLAFTSATDRTVDYLFAGGADEKEIRAAGGASLLFVSMVSVLALTVGGLFVLVALAFTHGLGNFAAMYVTWLFWGTVVFAAGAMAALYMYVYGRARPAASSWSSGGISVPHASSHPPLPPPDAHNSS